MKQRGIRLGIKRGMDLGLGALAGALTLPVVATAAVAIAVTDGLPVFFRQTRPGLGGHPFQLIKFRTMRTGDDPDAARLTPLGRFLRSTSIDELPQLYNVLRGDMSLVGPRPLLMEYLDRYSPEQARRNDVLPGITGWVQVNGRSAIGWEERFELDIWYVDHWSVWLDVKILAMTVARVIGRKGISFEGHATSPEFTGSAPTNTSPDAASARA
jgi:lipopolysaccharide/colanic/teichoic acid biosynthesis glycosyltransferase